MFFSKNHFALIAIAVVVALTIDGGTADDVNYCMRQLTWAKLVKKSLFSVRRGIYDIIQYENNYNNSKYFLRSFVIYLTSGLSLLKKHMKNFDNQLEFNDVCLWTATKYCENLNDRQYGFGEVAMSEVQGKAISEFAANPDAVLLSENTAVMAPRDFVNNTIAKNKVVIFSDSDNGYSHIAKNCFTKLDERFKLVEVNQRDDKADIQKVLEDKTGLKTLPCVFVNGAFIGGAMKVKDMAKYGELKTLLGK